MKERLELIKSELQLLEDKLLDLGLDLRQERNKREALTQIYKDICDQLLILNDEVAKLLGNQRP
jgi:hypothetical protein